MTQKHTTIYLDNAASTPLRTEVYDAMLPHLKETYGNAGSLHEKGRKALYVLEDTRTLVAKTLGVQGSEIIFTGSGTEANNLALQGIARAHSARGKHILVSVIEHKSILSSAERLREDGFDIEYIPVDTFGSVSIPDVMRRIRPDTILISLMYANNEIGTIEPIKELGKILRDTYTENSRPFLHTDACQAAGQLPINPHLLNVDLMTLNSSKVYGPKGVGLLYVREGVTISPIILGGEQEHGKRGGTENIASIFGFGEALKLAETEREYFSKHLITLRDACIQNIREVLPQAMLNGHPKERLPNNIHLSFPNIEGESLLLLLDTYGICVSTGSACGAHDLAPSHVLRAINQSDKLMHGSIRITLGRETTQEELSQTVLALTDCVRRLEAISPLPLHL